MFIRRSVTTVAVSPVAVTAAACGTQRGEQARSASPPPSFTPWPTCAEPVEVPSDLPSPPVPSVTGTHQKENGDRAPHYAENHAYRMQASMTADEHARGQASAKLIREELEKVRQEGGPGEHGAFGEERIAAALSRLGCGEEHGVYVGPGFYSVHTGVVCVSGYVTKDELTSEVHGAYIEPQPGTGPCVRNQGGH